MQHLLDVLEAQTHDINMNCNAQKTVCIVVRPKRCDRIVASGFPLLSRPIERTQQEILRQCVNTTKYAVKIFFTNPHSQRLRFRNANETAFETSWLGLPLMEQLKRLTHIN